MESDLAQKNQIMESNVSSKCESSDLLHLNSGLVLKSHQQEQIKIFSSRRLSCIDMMLEDYGSSETGPSIAIPFTWESQPGTPKVKINQRKLPPLTPPPSYFYSSPNTTKKTKPSFLRNIIPRIKSRKPLSPESPASSSSSWSSSSPWPSATRSVPPSPVTEPQYHERVSAFHDDSESSGFSRLCFGLSRGGSNPRSR